ncbi:uncharacterized protein LOC141646579 [Silene latifolia]|uniref:uncharacterized protein LOC141646579 n=1 Tax=Silene latifolia TaxID=37657 RepID=UPI003D772767
MEPTDPLYLHSAESTHPLVVDTKISGIENYLEWKRQMEIAVCSKRKLGFLTGVFKRPADNPVKTEAWDTCNSLLISCIFHNVEQPIKRSILKFRLNKELEDLEQGERSICEYFTDPRILWQNLEIMTDWPPVTQMTPEVNAWLDAQLKEQEKRKLFQFLNGLHPSYTTMRTNVLMMTPLATVEEAAALFQHEET